MSKSYNQEISSASEGGTSKHVQNTAMNTALSGKVLTKIRKDNLEYQKIDLDLKKVIRLKNLDVKNSTETG